MLRLLVADAYFTVRLGISSVVTRWSNHIAVDEADSLDGLFERLKSQQYDVLILDPVLAGGSGVEIIREIHDVSPSTHILVYSDTDELRGGVRAIRNGARGFLTKKCSILELTTALSKVSRGEIYISPLLAEKIAFDRHCGALGTLHENMTNREWEVFSMQVCGNSIKVCAQRLQVSVKTISTHKARLMAKLKLHSDSQIVHYAITHKLLEECEKRCALLSLNCVSVRTTPVVH
jgi:DNA-binding NarL/FixJ family response regulator